MRVVGLDLSLTSTGIAVITDGGATTDRLPSKGSKDATLAQRGARIADLSWRATRFAKGADLVVVEGPSYGQKAGQGAQHDRSGYWWAVVKHLQAMGLPTVEVPPTCRAKYATGRGNASKDDVLAAVVRRYLAVDVNGNDEADALVLAAMGARWLGSPIDNVPATHAAALDKVAWPEPGVAA